MLLVKYFIRMNLKVFIFDILNYLVTKILHY